MFGCYYYDAKHNRCNCFKPDAQMNLLCENKDLRDENAKLRELVKDLLNAWDDMQHEVVTGPAFDDCECRAYELGIEADA